MEFLHWLFAEWYNFWGILLLFVVVAGCIRGWIKAYRGECPLDPETIDGLKALAEAAKKHRLGRDR